LGGPARNYRRAQHGDWLHAQLEVLSREDPPLEVFIESLANSATLQFAMLPKTDKRCEFSLAGWFAVGANRYACFASTISNFEIYPWQLSASHGPIFRHSTAAQKPQSKHCYFVSISGDETMAKELRTQNRSLLRLLKRGVSISVISDKCRHMAAAVAARQSDKKQTTLRM